MKKVMIWIKMLPFIPGFVRKMNKYISEGASIEKRYLLLHSTLKRVIRYTPVNFEVDGLKYIDEIPNDQGFVIYGNHQGSYDPLFLASAISRPLTAVVKEETVKMPIINTVVKGLDAVPMDRKNIRASVKAIMKVTSMVKDGRNFIIFPEGTRSKSNDIGEFKSGSMKAALDSKCPIIVASFHNSFYAFEKAGRNKKVNLVLSKPMYYEDYGHMSASELSEYIVGMIKNNIEKIENNK